MLLFEKKNFWGGVKLFPNLNVCLKRKIMKAMPSCLKKNKIDIWKIDFIFSLKKFSDPIE